MKRTIDDVESEPREGHLYILTRYGKGVAREQELQGPVSIVAPVHALIMEAVALDNDALFYSPYPPEYAPGAMPMIAGELMRICGKPDAARADVLSWPRDPRVATWMHKLAALEGVKCEYGDSEDMVFRDCRRVTYTTVYFHDPYF